MEAEDGTGVGRFRVEGGAACRRCMDCGSLAGGGGGRRLVLGHRDGSIWVHNSRSGAQVAALHSHSTWAGSRRQNAYLRDLESIKMGVDPREATTRCHMKQAACLHEL